MANFNALEQAKNLFNKVKGGVQQSFSYNQKQNTISGNNPFTRFVTSAIAPVYNPLAEAVNKTSASTQKAINNPANKNNPFQSFKSAAQATGSLAKNTIGNPRFVAAAGSLAVPYGRGANFLTKAVVPGALQGGLLEASNPNATPFSVVQNAALGGALAGGVHGAFKAGKFVARELPEALKEIPSTLRNARLQPGGLQAGFANFEKIDKNFSPKKTPLKVANPKDPYFNVNKLNVTPEAKQMVKDEIVKLKPQVEKVIGKKLSNQQVIQSAQASSNLLKKTIGIDATEKYTADLLVTRQKLASLAQSGKADADFIKTLIQVKSHATNAGRVLQSLSIDADPLMKTSKSTIIDAVSRVEKDTAKIIEAAKGVDFNNEKQAINFYRQFVKPKTSDLIDAIRYNSMLSSPNTHINNFFSNFLNTSMVAPIEKTLIGTLDFLNPMRIAKGGQRTAFAGEGYKYAQGYAESVGKAVTKFSDVLTGKQGFTNLDLNNLKQAPLGTNTIKGKIATYGLSWPTKLLEASDQFFQELIKGGETKALKYRQSKGVVVSGLEKQAEEKAAYRVFRQELGGKEQGVLLNGIDDLTNKLSALRESDNPIVSTISKWTLPFIRTPVNILKQGVEYSPAGVLTLDAKNKTEQLAKAIIGSSVFLGAGMLVKSGNATWGMPRDKKQQDAFKSAGMQPYSVRVGDKWIAYNKLNPSVAFPIALLAAIQDSQQNKSLTDSQVNTILSGVGKWGQFFTDQSYVKNIGQLIAAAQGDPYAGTQIISSYPQQIVPYRALSGWIARTLDPYQRTIDPGKDWMQKQMESLMLQVPGLRQQVSPLTDRRGNPVPNTNRALNAVSPVKITTEQPAGKQEYNYRTTQVQANTFIKPLKQDIQSQTDETTSKVATQVFNQIMEKNPGLSQEVQTEILKRLNQRISTRVKKAVLVKNSPQIREVLKKIPKNDKEKLRIYLEAMKSAGMLNKEALMAQ